MMNSNEGKSGEQDKEACGDKLKLKGSGGKVDCIYVNGLRRTKEDVVTRVAEPLLKAKDFQQAVLAAHVVRTSLEDSGCFKNLEIQIDPSTKENGSPDGLEITVNAKERKRIEGGVHTRIGNNEGSIVLGLTFPNVLGRGERIQTEYSFGSKKTAGFNLMATKPLIGWQHANVNASIYQRENNLSWCQYRQVDKGTSIGTTFELAANVKHTFQWEGNWREVKCLRSGTPFIIREQAGHTIKSSVKHVSSVDLRDNFILPNTGILCRLQQEYAGLGGNVNFIKQELELQGNVPIFYDSVVQTAFQGGIMHSTSPTKGFAMCDRFFLGGPLTLRGFHYGGVNSSDDGYAQTFWSTAIHLYLPVPFFADEGMANLFRIHVFINTGNIGSFSPGKNFFDKLRILLNGFRLSIGLGIVLRISQMARFEINYCVPLKVQKTDRVVRGIQLGIGVSHL